MDTQTNFDSSASAVICPVAAAKCLEPTPEMINVVKSIEHNNRMADEADVMARYHRAKVEMLHVQFGHLRDKIEATAKVEAKPADPAPAPVAVPEQPAQKPAAKRGRPKKVKAEKPAGAGSKTAKTQHYRSVAAGLPRGFTPEQYAAACGGDRDTAIKQVYRMTGQGYLERVGAGIYAVKSAPADAATAPTPKEELLAQLRAGKAA